MKFTRFLFIAALVVAVLSCEASICAAAIAFYGMHGIMAILVPLFFLAAAAVAGFCIIPALYRDRWFWRCQY